LTVICIDCRYVGPRPSGIAEAVKALVDHLPALAPDLEFLFLRHRSHPSRLNLAANVREIELASPANGPATMWWLPKIVDLTGVDLFHAPFNIMPAGLSMPTVTTIHDMMWMVSPELCDRRLASIPSRLFFRHGIARALSLSTAITTVSAASRDAIAGWSSEAGAKTHVTLSGVSEEFCPGIASIESSAGNSASGQKRFVLTVGQYAPYKNHEGAVRAFAQAFADRDDIELLLVQRMGAGAERLLAIASETGAVGRVRILKSIPRHELIALYRRAAVLLHPSFCEGFGNPLAEAMACGCPVVTSNVSAMPEVTGGAARYANPYDVGAIATELRAVVDEPVEADRLSALGIARAGELSWHRFAEQTLQVYRKVLSERGRLS
jgi:glycosyltransferase involved in cell wall biosynthesis